MPEQRDAGALGEPLGKDPAALVEFVARRQNQRLVFAPTILALLTQKIIDEHRATNAPRLVLFAGEVFPIAALKQLRALWPEAVMWNLYGPTETNVCTGFRIPATIPPDRTAAFPIGSVCPPLSARVVDEHGHDLPLARSASW